MTLSENLRSELANLDDLLSVLDSEGLEEFSPEWMTRQSLLDLQVQLMTQLETHEGEAEIEIRLIGGAERSNRVEASFLGTFLRELQSTVAAIVQSLVSGERRRGAFPQAVLDLSTLRVAPSAAGSFVVLLEGPQERPAQAVLGGEEEIPPFDEAVVRILDVFEAVENDIEGETLRAAISDLGGHRALGHLKAVARQMAITGTSGRLIQRSPYLGAPREAMMTSPGANRLQELLSQTTQTTEIEYVTGRLSGVRWTRGMFDLEVGEGEDRKVISGSIVRSIRPTIQGAFDTIVQAELEKTVTETPVEEEARVTYRLVGIDVPRPGTGPNSHDSD